jgi:hypothetical protein
MPEASTSSAPSAVNPTIEPTGCIQSGKLLDQTYSTKSPNISVEEAEVSGYTLKEDGTLHPTLDDQGEIGNPELSFKFDRLCSLCTVITREALLPTSERIKDRQMPFYDSETKLRRSVLQGCHLCALFWAENLFGGLEDINDHATDITPSARLAHVTVEFDDSLQLRYHHLVSSEEDITLWIGKRGESRHETSVLVVIDELEQVTREIGPQNLAAAASASNASKATFDVATSWLNECFSNHESCRRMQESTTQSPLRLIDMGAANQSRVFLVYPKNAVPYVTLSHCWGISEVLRLTQANHDELIKGIRKSTLPQLYRDAVQVVRRLGFRYIWIDSLCIIQDSVEDWKNESAHMGYIYRGSVFTLAALSAKDSEASLYTRYLPQCTEPCLVKRYSKSEEDALVIGTSREIKWPLHERAWVMQERLLATRTLNYTNRGIQWNCIEANHATPGYDSVFIRGQSAWNNLSMDPMLRLNAASITPETRMEGQQNWMQIVNKYSRSLLTFPEDRPHALKGVISVLEEHTQLNFVSGLCVDFLPYSVLWAPGSPTDAKTWTDSLSHCPSWSSTFRSGGSWHRGPYENIIGDRHVAETSICSETLLLRVKGKCFGPIFIEPVLVEDSKQPGPPSSDNEFRGVDLHGNLIQSTQLCSGPYPMFVSEPLLDFVLDRRIQVEFVLVVTDSFLPPDHQTSRIGFGLILTKLENEIDKWRRVGWFTVREFDSFGDSKTRTCFEEEKEYLVR